MKKHRVVAALLAIPLLACSHAARDVPPSAPPSTSEASAPAATMRVRQRDDGLQGAIAQIAAERDGRVAVTVLNLETHAYASLHGDMRMPMMSVFKLPIAVAAFVDIEAGKLRLDQKVPISEAELRPTVSPIAGAWAKGEHAPTLETLLSHVLIDSDNTAGDKLVTLLGGGAAITARLRALGLTDIDVVRQEIDIAAMTECPDVPKPPGGWTGAAIEACAHGTPAAQLAALRHEIEAPVDGATTDALVDLLARLDRGTLLNEASRRWLLDTLVHVTTGPQRLRGRLPPATPVAHKTGTGDTIGGVNLATNDVGIVTMPSGDRFVIAVMTAGSTGDPASREATIARIAKASWDAFVK